MAMYIYKNIKEFELFIIEKWNISLNIVRHYRKKT